MIVIKNTLKTFDDFKKKQQKYMKQCRSMYIVKVYSIHCTLR